MLLAYTFVNSLFSKLPANDPKLHAPSQLSLWGPWLIEAPCPWLYPVGLKQEEKWLSSTRAWC